MTPERFTVTDAALSEIYHELHPRGRGPPAWT